MKHTLTLTGSSAALVAALAAFDAAEGNSHVENSTSTGTGTVAPTPIPSAPISAAPIPLAPIPSNGSDDEDGEASTAATDSAGLPWDERIHSSSRKVGKDGTWNKRRGGPSGAELAAIEAELRAGLAVAPEPVSMPAQLPDAPAPVPVPPQPMPVTPVAPAPVPVPPQPVVPAPVPPMPVAAPTPAVEQPATPATVAAAAPASLDFPSFMQVIGPKMGEGDGQINSAYLAAVCQIHDLGSITDLALKPEMIPTIVAQFTADGRWQ